MQNRCTKSMRKIRPLYRANFCGTTPSRRVGTSYRCEFANMVVRLLRPCGMSALASPSLPGLPCEPGAGPVVWAHPPCFAVGRHTGATRNAKPNHCLTTSPSSACSPPLPIAAGSWWPNVARLLPPWAAAGRRNTSPEGWAKVCRHGHGADKLGTSPPPGEMLPRVSAKSGPGVTKRETKMSTYIVLTLGSLGGPR